MSLTLYHKKRDFKKTPEPKGKEYSSDKLIFVVQKHQASRLHYDFRLSIDGVLKSWAVPKGPSYNPKEKRLAIETEDHPLDYADFEGVIPQGEYGGGTVMLFDAGTWEPLGEDVLQDYKKGQLAFKLHGKKLKGSWALIRMKNFRGGKNQWLLFKKDDEHAQTLSDHELLNSKSIKSHLSLEEISKASR